MKLLHGAGHGAQAEVAEHVHRLFELLAQIFNLQARAVAVAVHRAKDQIRPLHAVFEALAAGSHVPGVVFENPATFFHQLPIGLLHALDAADDEHPLLAQVIRRTLRAIAAAT